MEIKLVRVADAPPGHPTPKGHTITDPAEIAKITADPHLSRMFVKVAMTPAEIAERDAKASAPA